MKEYAQAMRLRRRRNRSFSGRREVAIGLGVYALYLLVARTKRSDRGRLEAARNAERVVALERRLGIHPATGADATSAACQGAASVARYGPGRARRRL